MFCCVRARVFTNDTNGSDLFQLAAKHNTKVGKSEQKIDLTLDILNLDTSSERTISNRTSGEMSSATCSIVHFFHSLQGANREVCGRERRFVAAVLKENAAAVRDGQMRDGRWRVGRQRGEGSAGHCRAWRAASRRIASRRADARRTAARRAVARGEDAWGTGPR